MPLVSRPLVSRFVLAGLIATVITGGMAATADPVLASGQRGGAVCADGSEAEALRVRTLQNRLMVGALACNETEDYDAFVARFDSLLAEQGRVMADYFARRHGAKRAKRLVGDYLTAQANQHSLDSMVDRHAFCEEARVTLDALLEGDETGLRTLSASVPAEKVESPLACVRS